ncbi:MAG: hypothetical protein IBJ12_12925 [Sphingomonadaceae bacterium]|nr:hypothetical protein [Sphingomonadaceae bacterium]
MTELAAFSAGKDGLAMLVAIIHGIPVDAAAYDMQLPAHLAFQHALEAQGILFCSGPTSATHQPRDGRGLTILRNVTISEAMAIWADEPFYKAGVRTAEFLSWQVNEAAPPLKALLRVPT